MPIDESVRIRALHEARILDTPASAEFDSIVELARSIFDCPMALITLVDTDRLWFRAKAGVTADQAAREGSFCGHVVDTTSALIVPDATRDARFAENVFVSGMFGLRFYAGVPLTEGDICYGTLCVADTKPRSFGDPDRARLERLATVAIGLIREQRQTMLLREQRRDLELKQARFEQTERSAKVGGFEMDVQTGAVVWSDQIYRTVGLPVGQPLTPDVVIGCYAPEEREGMRARIRNVLSGEDGGIDREYRIITPQGEDRWVHVTSDIEKVDGQPRRLFGIVQDVSERVRHERELLRAANTDSLTGLGNRAAYIARLGIATREPASTVGLLLIDVDHLKQINDTLGHAAGDVVLKQIAARLSDRIDGRGKAFRLGGDEFAVLIEGNASSRRMAGLARSLIEFVARPLHVDGTTIMPKVTAGGALFQCGMDAAALAQNADFALYHAKETRRGSYIEFEPRLRTRISTRIEKIREVERALTQGRLFPYYQPIVGGTNGEVSGFEALVRMRREDGSVVSAGEFHEALEDPHLSHQVTSVMVREIASDLRAWAGQGLPGMRISLNVSAADFVRGDLEGRITAAFASKGIPLDRLIIEVTETVFMQGVEETVAGTLQRLRKRGVLVALDDFGTGFASLTHLRSLPVDIIKIDKSFIDTMLQDASSLAIVELVLGLARKLNLKVTAEGVEHFRQAHCLLEQGCASLQGYFFSRPMPQDKVRDFLVGRKPWQVAGERGSVSA
jgi:diguanylate cyclase (GGDEF)-like protein/PAS domain S-box-containing protein